MTHWSSVWLKAIVATLALSLGCNAIAQVSDLAYANMQRAVGGIIQQSAVARGFSTADPRTYSTLYSVGKVAVAGAAAVGVGALVAGTSPAWGTVLAVAIVGGVVSYGVSLAIDKTVSWLFGTDPTHVQTSVVTPLGSNPQYIAIPGSTLVKTPATPSGWSIITGREFSCPDGTYCSSAGQTYFLKNPQLIQGNLSCEIWVFRPITNTETLLSNSRAVCSGSTPYTFPATTTSTTSSTTTAAFAAVPTATKTQPVDYQAMALIINHLWKQAAAQPDYAGIPYSVTQPVTSTDVQTWASANPSAYPTVAALIAPISSPTTGLVPSISTSTQSGVQPATSATSPTSTNPAQAQTQSNLGSDPNIGSPTLEVTPTAQMILNPLLNLLPDMKSFSVPGHVGACPKPVFEVFGKSITMDQHCTLFEQQRATLYAAMVLSFTLVALFIVLSA